MEPQDAESLADTGGTERDCTLGVPVVLVGNGV